MIKNFQVKKGDQLGFTLTFTNPTPVSDIFWGIKNKYDDTSFEILKTFKNFTRNVVFIGDSYLVGISPDGTIKNFGQFVVEDLNITKYTIKARGGAGFTRARPDLRTFLELLNELPNDDTVTDLIICAGYNDQNSSENDIVTAMTSFFSTARIKFPNADIKCSMIGWSTLPSVIPALERTIVSYKKGCEVNNIYYMDSVTDAIHNSIYISSDTLHPNIDGQKEIAKRIEPYLPNPTFNGITKVDDYRYRFLLNSEETKSLSVSNHVYDIRFTNGEENTTPLSGKIMIKDTVFEG